MDETPQRRFRDLQDQIRMGIWDHFEHISYNPWYQMVTMALSGEISPELAFDCHRELAQYILPKLKAIEIQGSVELHHTSELQGLFAQWEAEEAREREGLPPWEPPSIEALNMRHSASEDGSGEVWDLDDPDDEPDEESHAL